MGYVASRGGRPNGSGQRGERRTVTPGGEERPFRLSRLRGKSPLSGHEGVNRVLGRLAEILPESGARVVLNEVQGLLEGLRKEAYWNGYDDAVLARDDRANEAAEPAYPMEWGPGAPNTGTIPR